MAGSSLTSVLYFLSFGLFFYWMMKRGGCGMHAHGGHKGHDHTGHHDAPDGLDARRADVTGSATDPVCGMPLDPKHAAGMRTVSERTFYFCSADCLAKFDADPEGMASRASPPKQAHHQHHGH